MITEIINWDFHSCVAMFNFFYYLWGPSTLIIIPVSVTIINTLLGILRLDLSTLMCFVYLIIPFSAYLSVVDGDKIGIK